MAKSPESPDPAPAPVVLPTLPAMTYEQLAALLKMAVTQPTTDPNTPMAILADSLRASLAAMNKLTEATERTVSRSNAHGQDVSIFNFKVGCVYCETKRPHPELDVPAATAYGLIGHPKPLLTRKVYFPKGAPVVVSDCTVLEAELINAFTASRTSRAGTWKATISPDDKELVLDVPAFRLDERAELPPLVLILEELLHGASSADPVIMLTEMRAMRAELDALRAQLAASTAA